MKLSRRDSTLVVTSSVVGAIALGACGELPPASPSSGSPHKSSPNSVAQPSPSPLAQPKVGAPTEWAEIGYAYHGVLLDKGLRPVKLDSGSVEQLLNSFFASLSASAKHTESTRSPSPAKLRADTLKAALDKDFTLIPQSDRLRAKVEMLKQAIGLASAAEKAVYLEKLNALVAVATPAGLVAPHVGTELKAKLTTLKVDTTDKPSAITSQETQYMARCRASEVPMPPPWPGESWKDLGPLVPDFTFASFGTSVRAEVLTSVSDGGVCAALPRYGADDGLQAMGVICQSAKTGAACFWDNIDLATGARLEGKDVRMNPSSIQSAAELEENCTGCHRGENAFLIHPKTALGLIPNRKPQRRYGPVGPEQWLNPTALSERGSGGACADCHEIAAPTPGYCRLVKWAATKTMPSSLEPAGWDTPAEDFKAHIAFLKAECPSGN